MKIKRLITLFLCVIAIILETLPTGVVLLFANPEGEPWKSTFSYFSLTPFGYANFGPLITSLLTCIILLLSLISLFNRKNKIISIIKYLSAISVITSLMPLIFGINYITPINISVTLILLVIFLTSLYKEKE